MAFGEVRQHSLWGIPYQTREYGTSEWLGNILGRSHDPYSQGSQIFGGTQPSANIDRGNQLHNIVK